MNQFEQIGGKEAKIKYLDGDYQIISSGSFVRCAVTEKPIPLEELRYWSVARQEAYIDVETSFEREQQFRK